MLPTTRSPLARRTRGIVPAPARAGVAAVAALALAMGPARAEIPDNEIELGVIDNSAGSVQPGMRGSTLAAVQLAREDFENEPHKVDVELHVDDGTDTGAETRQVSDWLEHEHVSALVELAPSRNQAGIDALMTRHDRVALLVGLPEAEAGSACATRTMRWGGGAATLGRTAARALVKAGARRWFFVNGDSSQASASEAAAQAEIRALGGTVLGSVPDIPGNGGADPVEQAARSGADAVAFGVTGPTLEAALSAAAQDGMAARTRIVLLDPRLPELLQMSSRTVVGAYVPTIFYAGRDAQTRDFARIFTRRFGAAPSPSDAAAYAGTLALLDTIKRARSIDGAAVMSGFGNGPVGNGLFQGALAASGNRIVYTTYLLRVTRPTSPDLPGDTVSHESVGNDVALAGTVEPMQPAPAPGGTGCASGASP